MKKTGLFLLLLATAAWAQDSTMASAGDANAPQGTAPTSVSFPIERLPVLTATTLTRSP